MLAHAAEHGSFAKRFHAVLNVVLQRKVQAPSSAIYRPGPTCNFNELIGTPDSEPDY